MNTQEQHEAYDQRHNECAELQKQRDQWRECAEMLATSLKLWHPDHGVIPNPALTKFNALKAKETK